MIGVSNPAFHVAFGVVLLVVTTSSLVNVCTDPAHPKETNTKLRYNTLFYNIVGMYLAVAIMMLPILLLIKEDFMTLLFVMPLFNSCLLLLVRFLDVTRMISEKTITMLVSMISGMNIVYLSVAVGGLLLQNTIN